jgi:hypothetical protein
MTTPQLIERMRRKLCSLRTDMLQAMIDNGIELPPLRERLVDGARQFESRSERELLQLLIAGFQSKLRENETCDL